MQRVDLTGKNFGRLTVVEKAKKPGGAKYAVYWRCKCKCGNPIDTLVSTGNLQSGLVRSCSCLKTRRFGDNPNWKGVGQLGLSYWSSVLRHAKDRNIPVAITIRQAWNKYTQQSGRCALSGQPLVIDELTRSKHTTASLDRIDSTKGYILGNVQWIHKDVNRMKQDLNQPKFIELCKLVAKYIK